MIYCSGLFILYPRPLEGCYGEWYSDNKVEISGCDYKTLPIDPLSVGINSKILLGDNPSSIRCET